MDIQIRVGLEHPNDGNGINIYVADSRNHLPPISGLGVYEYSFSAREDDPTKWLAEALESVAQSVRNGSHNFWAGERPSMYNVQPEYTPPVVDDDYENWGPDEIPF